MRDSTGRFVKGNSGYWLGKKRDISHGIFLKGHKTNLGKKHRPETIVKMKGTNNLGFFRKGCVPWNKGMVGFLKGVPKPESFKINFKNTLLRKKRERLKIIYKNRNIKVSKALTGRKLSENHREKLRKSSIFFIDGRSPLRSLLISSQEWKDWRKGIFERDNYQCQKCLIKKSHGNNIEIHPHHIKRFSDLISEFLIQYNQFSPIEDKEVLLRLAINHKPFWDVSNGITLCKNCHILIHKEIPNESKK